MKIEEMPAAIAAKCEEALVAAKRLAELDRMHDEADDRSAGSRNRMFRIENEICETEDDFKGALLAVHGMMAAFESRARGLAICDVEVE